MPGARIPPGDPPEFTYTTEAEIGGVGGTAPEPVVRDLQVITQKEPPDLGKQRYALALWLLSITTALTVAIGVTAWMVPEATWQRFDNLTPLTLTPFHTLLSVAIGWYFAEKRKP